MQNLLKNGYKANFCPSGHNILDKFPKDNRGAISPNLLKIAHTESNSAYFRLCKLASIKLYPVRYPWGFVEFSIKFLTFDRYPVLNTFTGTQTKELVAEIQQS